MLLVIAVFSMTQFMLSSTGVSPPGKMGKGHLQRASPEWSILQTLGPAEDWSGDQGRSPRMEESRGQESWRKQRAFGKAPGIPGRGLGPSTVSWSSRLCGASRPPWTGPSKGFKAVPCPSCLLQHILTRGRFLTTVQAPLTASHPWRQPAWVPLHGPALAPRPGRPLHTHARTGSRSAHQRAGGGFDG